MKPIERVNWDSEFFGFEICRINPESIKNDSDLQGILSDAKAQGFKLCTFTFPQGDAVLTKAAEANNGHLADEKITFNFKFDKNYNYGEKEGVFEYDIEKYLLEDMYSLSIQSSHQSRFRIDGRFGQHYCDKMYKIWMDKSLNGERASKIFIYPEGNRVLGMITLGRRGEFGTIELISVDEKSRGKNIGKKLLNKSIEYFLNNGLTELHVDTQLRNDMSCNFMKKSGMSVYSIVNIFHFWFK